MTLSSKQHASTSSRHFISILITLVILGLILGGLYMWRTSVKGQQQAWPQQTIQVSALQVMPREAPVSINAVGELTAVQEVMLSAETAGRVTAIQFQSGMEVDQHSPLVQLFDAPEQAELKASQAQLDFAQAQYRRAENLAPMGAESKEHLNQKKAAYQQAQADVEQIEARLRQKQILAPFAGRIGLRRVDLGQYINPGDKVATLTNLSKLYVEFSVPQQALSNIQVKAPVQVHTDAFPDHNFTAQVNAIDPQIDRNTRNIRVQATLDNPDHQLQPGMYVSASLTLPHQTDAILLPITAVLTSAQGNSVVAIRGDHPLSEGKAEYVSIQLGRRIGNQIVIKQGLKSGDVIVTNGQNRIQPGASLKVVQPQDRVQPQESKENRI